MREVGMQTQTAPRVRKRLPCTLSTEARNHNGMILNLSERGLFVQTSLPAKPGTLLNLYVLDPLCGDAIPLEATVVWRRRVTARITGVTQSGMGLRLLSQPSEWQQMMCGLLGNESRSIGEPTTGESSPTSADDAEATVDARPHPPAFAFDVRLAKPGSPRSRRVVVESDDEAAAREEAQHIAGNGWTILEIRRR
jgi:hypothetical protein